MTDSIAMSADIQEIEARKGEDKLSNRLNFPEQKYDWISQLEEGGLAFGSVKSRFLTIQANPRRYQSELGRLSQFFRNEFWKNTMDSKFSADLVNSAVLFFALLARKSEKSVETLQVLLQSHMMEIDEQVLRIALQRFTFVGRWDLIDSYILRRFSAEEGRKKGLIMKFEIAVRSGKELKVQEVLQELSKMLSPTFTAVLYRIILRRNIIQNGIIEQKSVTERFAEDEQKLVNLAIRSVLLGHATVELNQITGLIRNITEGQFMLDTTLVKLALQRCARLNSESSENEVKDFIKVVAAKLDPDDLPRVFEYLTAADELEAAKTLKDGLSVLPTSKNLLKSMLKLNVKYQVGGVDYPTLLQEGYWQLMDADLAETALRALGAEAEGWQDFLTRCLASANIALDRNFVTDVLREAISLGHNLQVEGALMQIIHERGYMAPYEFYRSYLEAVVSKNLEYTANIAYFMVIKFIKSDGFSLSKTDDCQLLEKMVETMLTNRQLAAAFKIHRMLERSDDSFCSLLLENLACYYNASINYVDFPLVQSARLQNLCLQIGFTKSRVPLSPAFCRHVLTALLQRTDFSCAMQLRAYMNNNGVGAADDIASTVLASWLEQLGRLKNAKA